MMHFQEERREMVAGGDISHTAVVPTVYLSVCLSLCCFISPSIYPSLLLNYISAFRVLVSAFFFVTRHISLYMEKPDLWLCNSLKLLYSIASSQVRPYLNENLVKGRLPAGFSGSPSW